MEGVRMEGAKVEGAKGIAKGPIRMLLLQSSLNLASFVFFRTLTRNSTEVFT
jgi:hypothetical protein